jgi:hypothetical protein
LARHAIRDFDAWKAVFDEFEPARREGGFSESAVYREVDDAKVITTCDDFATLEDAKAFVRSDRLESGMRRAGVAGEPQVWFGMRIA